MKALLLEAMEWAENHPQRSTLPSVWQGLKDDYATTLAARMPVVTINTTPTGAPAGRPNTLEVRSYGPDGQLLRLGVVEPRKPDAAWMSAIVASSYEPDVLAVKVSNLMAFAGCALSERQECVLDAALRTILEG